MVALLSIDFCHQQSQQHTSETGQSTVHFKIVDYFKNCFSKVLHLQHLSYHLFDIWINLTSKLCWSTWNSIRTPKCHTNWSCRCLASISTCPESSERLYFDPLQKKGQQKSLLYKFLIRLLDIIRYDKHFIMKAYKC